VTSRKSAASGCISTGDTGAVGAGGKAAAGFEAFNPLIGLLYLLAIFKENAS